ncbi:hypothetical protein HHK36_031578 [Tetracentron sinense]|uniref:Uncharacterized protein n=1 Tax=Tetracentron sinense TaxID=13715 RepID=A0A835CYE5_TETSI|nr:hypothetical protein HHK36_031578 [Tetracentron sinense]
MTEYSSVSKRLDGKVVIITGSATAHLFANNGARVVVIADIQDELGQRVATSIGLHRCTYIHCDVTDEEQVKSMVDHTVQTYGQLDIMFSNAGIVSPTNQTILELYLIAFDRLFAVNVRGMAACVKHAARAMVDGGVKGSIVCTASLAATVGSNKWSDYTMSKHAVVGLVRSASRQLGEYGIRVNCVSPSGLATPLLCNAYHMEPEEVEKLVEPFTSLKGVVLKVSNVADAVLFLASHDSAFVTGHDLVVHGGCRPH